MNNSKAESYYNIAISFYEKSNYKLAIENFKKAISLNPNDARVYYNLGITYHCTNQHDSAVDCYKMAIKINPNDDEAYYNLGLVYYDKRDYSLAEECYIKATSINPNDAEIFYNLGVICAEKTEYKRAIETLDKVLALNPNHSDAKDALKYVKNLICNIDHSVVESHYNTGVTHAEKGEYDLAISSFEKALELNPYHLGSKEALKDVNQLVEDIEIKDAEAKKHYDVAISSLENGDYVVAEENLKKAAEIDPRNVEIFFNLGIIYFENKQYELAIESFNEVLEINPYHFNAKEAINCIRGIMSTNKINNADKNKDNSDDVPEAVAVKGETPDEVQVKNDVIKSSVNDEKSLKDAENHFNLGLNYASNGDFDLAIDSFKKALSLNANHNEAKEALYNALKLLSTCNPKDAERFFIQGMAFADGARIDLAIDRFTKALSINPYHTKAKDALEYAKRFQEQQNAQKNDPEAIYLNGISHADKGEYDLAIECFQKVLAINPAHLKAKEAMYLAFKSMNNIR